MKRFQKIFLFLSICSLGVHAQNINHPSIACPMGLSVNSYNGNLFLDRKDLFIQGRKLSINLTFYYNSFSDSINLGYGKGWSLEYSMRYQPIAGGVRIIRGDGFQIDFKELPTGGYKAPTGVFDSLAQYQPQKFAFITKQKTRYLFDDASHKKLTRIIEINGNYLDFAYTGGLMTQVTDAAGRSIQLNYNGNLLSEIVDALDIPIRKTRYTYDTYGNLVEAADFLGNKFKYAYNIKGPMKKFTDRNSNVADIIYNSDNAVKEVITCITNQRFSYDKKVSQVVELVSGQNQITSYRYNDKGYLIQKQGNCCGFNTKYEYDNDGNITKFIDANNHVYTFTYDNSGNMSSLTDPLKASEYYTYDPTFSNVTSFIDKNGNLIKYEYDVKGNKIRISYPLGITLSFNYDSNGDCIVSQNGKGFSTHYSFDKYGNLIEEAKPLAATLKYSYDIRSRFLSKRDAKLNFIIYTYDLLDRLIAVKDPLNNNVVYVYDPNGNRVSRKNELNYESVIEFDALNRSIKVTNTLGKSRRFVYNAKSKLISVADETGATTTYSYDNLNRLVGKTNPLDETIGYVYDEGSNVKYMSLPNGNIKNYEYDANSRLVTIRDSRGVINSFEYDNIGKVVARVNGDNDINTFSYDALGRIISLTDALGQPKIYSYDANSNVSEIIDRNGYSTKYLYDDLDRKTVEIDPLNKSTTYVYDLNSNLIELTDANGNRTRLAYDALNHKTGEFYSVGSPITLTYDAVGNLSEVITGNGSIKYSYDAMNRLVLKNFPDDNDDVFKYDDAGRNISANNKNAKTSFTYDAANHLTSETLDSNTTRMLYNTHEKTRRLFYPNGQSILENYDERGRLVALSVHDSVEATFTYDGADRPVNMRYANSVSTFFSYDRNGNVDRIATNPPGLQNFSYTYDKENNVLTRKQDFSPQYSESYNYDKKNQLVEFRKGVFDGATIVKPALYSHFTLDNLGNRLTVDNGSQINIYVINALNQYVKIQSTADNVLAYDDNGNLVENKDYHYLYDLENRLIEVGKGAAVSYKYDALGRRVKKIVGSDTSSYCYFGQNLLEEKQNKTRQLSSYVYGAGIDNPLLIQKDSSKHYYHKDSHGSITMITDSKGNPKEFYEYDVFGKSYVYNSSNVQQSETQIGNPFRFSSREYNQEIDNYYYRARYYDHQLGRFLQRDPLGLKTGINLYTFVDNNPANLSDPTGLDPQGDACRQNCEYSKKQGIDGCNDIEAGCIIGGAIVCTVVASRNLPAGVVCGGAAAVCAVAAARAKSDIEKAAANCIKNCTSQEKGRCENEGGLFVEGECVYFIGGLGKQN